MDLKWVEVNHIIEKPCALHSYLGVIVIYTSKFPLFPPHKLLFGGKPFGIEKFHHLLFADFRLYDFFKNSLSQWDDFVKLLHK